MPIPAAFTSYRVDHDAIRKARDAKGWSMDEAARRAGMLRPDGSPNRQRWNDIEKGTIGARLPAVTLFQLAQALGRKMEHFIVDAE